MITTTVHLLPGQSVSLTTGKITNQESITEAPAPWAVHSQARAFRLRRSNLRANDLLQLQSIIENDPEIPSGYDITVPIFDFS